MSTPSSETPAVDTENATPSTGWRHQLPSRVRSRPRAYGTGRYGTDHYDNRDDTRYAWGRIAPAITVFLGLLLGAAAPARATNSYCEAADAATPILALCQPSVDVEGANAWGTKWNTNAQMVEDQFQVVAAATGTVAASVAAETAARIVADGGIGVSTKTLNTVKASTGTNGDITQLTGLTTPLTVGQGGTGVNSITAHGIVVGEGASASTATPAMGNGGLVIGAGTGVDPSTGTLTAGSAITVTNTAGKIQIDVDSSSAAVKNGGFVRNSEIDGSSITKLNASGFVPNALIDGSSITKLSAGLVPNALIDASSVTKQGNTFNAANKLVQLNGSAQYPALDGSLITGLSGAISGLTAGYIPRASASNAIVNGNFYETSSSDTISVPLYNPSTFTAIGNYFVFRDTRPANTAADAHNTAAFTQIKLTSVYVNIEGVATLASNQATIPKGTWRCTWFDCFQNVGATAAVRLRDMTNSATLGVSYNCTSNGAGVNSPCPGFARFTNAAQITMELQSRAAGVTACSANNYGEQEQYAELRCDRELR